MHRQAPAVTTRAPKAPKNNQHLKNKPTKVSKKTVKLLKTTTTSSFTTKLSKFGDNTTSLAPSSLTTINKRKGNTLSGSQPRNNPPNLQTLPHFERNFSTISTHTALTPSKPPTTITKRGLNSINSTSITSTQLQPNHTQPNTKKLTLQQDYSSKLKQLLMRSKQSPIKITKRQFMNKVREVVEAVVGGAMKAFNAVKDLSNPFRNKRGNTISIDGTVPWKYHVRNALFVGAVGVTAIMGAYFLIKFAILSLKIAFVFLIFHGIKKKLVDISVKRGDLDRAIMFETWGESHSNDNTLCKVLWLINPVSWFRRAHHFLSIDRRKQMRCQEIADQVTKHLEVDTRMPRLFSQDFVLGEMDRNLGNTGLEETTMYDGFVAIPVYSAAPTVVDIPEFTTSSRGSRTRSNKTITGSDRPNAEIQKELKIKQDKEIHRRLVDRYGKDPEEHTYERTVQVIDEIQQEAIAEVDVDEDVNYKYKFYKALPKWKWDELDADEKDAVVTGKRETFHHNRNIQDRISILDFDALSLRWKERRWDFLKNRFTSKEILLPTSDQDLVEVGTVYAFFSAPSLQNLVSEGNNSVRIDAINILTQGTLEPFELEKVFVIGGDIDRLTLFKKDAAKWSPNPALKKDRSIFTHRKERLKRDEDFAEGKNNPPQKSATKVVDFDLETNKPVVEAEFVRFDENEQGNDDDNNNNNNNNNNNGNNNNHNNNNQNRQNSANNNGPKNARVVEAEIL